MKNRSIRTIFTPFLIAVVFLALQSQLSAASTEETLDAAKSEYAKASSDAKDTLVAAMDAEVRRVASTGNLDSALAERKALKEFQDSGKLPTNPRYKPALTAYRTAIDRAKKKLIDAYKGAISEYTKAFDLEKAQATKQEMQQFESGSAGGGGGGTAPPDLKAKDEGAMPEGADSIPSVRQFLDAQRAADAAVADQHQRIAQALDQKIASLSKGATADSKVKIQSLQDAKEKLEADGTIPNLPEVQSVVRQTHSTVDAANAKADKAAERAIGIARSQKSDALVAWLEAERMTLGSTFDWATAKNHVKYDHIEPTYSRAGYAPYIDEPPTRLLDGDIKKKEAKVGWQGVKPNLIRFTFDRNFQPKAIRLYFEGNESNPEVNVPKSITVYDSADPKTRKKMGSLTTTSNKSGWFEVPLLAHGRTYVLDIDKTPVWTLLTEVEFK